MRLARVAQAFVVAAALVVVPATAASAKSFSLTSLDTVATVRTDGSMDVRERVVYSFTGGTFTFATRSFAPKYIASITDLTVTGDGQPLSVEPPGGDHSKAWKWTYPPAYDERREFDVSYHVANAVQVGSDVGELYWQFLGTDHQGVESVNIEVDLPGEFPAATPDAAETDTSIVRAWGHGPRNGSTVVSGSSVVQRVSGVPAGRFVETRVVIPVRAFSGVPAGSGSRLPTILNEELHFISQDDKVTIDRNRARVFAPVLAGLGGFGFVFSWRKWGKDPKAPADMGEYWREPLKDPPAVVTSNLGYGSVGGDAFAATVVDLAQRKYLTITEEHITRFGPDKHLYHFTASDKGHDVLLPYERSLLGRLFAKGPVVNSDEFAKWARTYEHESRDFWEQWQKDVKADLTTHGYVEHARVIPWILGVLAGGAALLGGIGALALHTSLGWIGVAAGVAVFGCLPLLRRRTPAGAEAAARAMALKHFLSDFSHLDEAPVASLVIWERFLVYATALGVADKLVAGLALKVPAVANDPAFAGWYVSAGGRGDLGRINDFPGGFGTVSTSAMAPSSSGSSGGFSGGGGGGGGGGGFGAG